MSTHPRPEHRPLRSARVLNTHTHVLNTHTHVLNTHTHVLNTHTRPEHTHARPEHTHKHPPCARSTISEECTKAAEDWAAGRAGDSMQRQVQWAAWSSQQRSFMLDALLARSALARDVSV
jgi:phage/plasmid-associated DNA primase